MSRKGRGWKARSEKAGAGKKERSGKRWKGATAGHAEKVVDLRRNREKTGIVGERIR